MRKTYDYIIVGGGTAGSVLAARLSENTSNTILLLESGSLPLWCTTVPGLSGMAQRTVMDWQFRTVTQNRIGRGLQNGQAMWPRGRAVGGSGTLDYLFYTHGNPGDYDRWANLGATGWDYNSVLPYIIRAEGLQQQPSVNRSTTFGEAGPIKLTRTLPSKLGDTILRAAAEAKFPLASEHSMERQGFGYVLAPLLQSRRQSTFWTYLAPAASRPNLDILISAHVSKVIFDGNKRAAAVEYFHSWFFNMPSLVEARREILLTAGAVGTPQLLLLSGVGPKEHLKNMNITTIVDLPVGKNLRDHVSTGITFSVDMPLNTTQLDLNYFTWRQALDEYMVSGTGPMATGGPFQVVGFANSGVSLNLPEPDLMLLFGSKNFYTSENIRNLHLKPEGIPKIDSNSTLNTFFGLAVLLHPYSFGEVRLRSLNPFHHPIIDLQYLEDDNDRQVLLEGLQAILKISEQSAMRRASVRVGEGALDVCKNHSFFSDNYLRCLIRHRTHPFHSPIGTCRMGSDVVDSVVNPTLRVHETRGLRVIDASAFTTHVSGGPLATVIMIAEKAADMILRDSTNSQIV